MKQLAMVICMVGWLIVFEFWVWNSSVPGKLSREQQRQRCRHMRLFRGMSLRVVAWFRRWRWTHGPSSSWALQFSLLRSLVCRQADWSHRNPVVFHNQIIDQSFNQSINSGTFDSSLPILDQYWILQLKRPIYVAMCQKLNKIAQISNCVQIGFPWNVNRVCLHWQNSHGNGAAAGMLACEGRLAWLRAQRAAQWREHLDNWSRRRKCLALLHPHYWSWLWLEPEEPSLEGFSSWKHSWRLVELYQILAVKLLIDERASGIAS